MANEYLDLVESAPAPVAPVNDYADLVPSTQEIALPRVSAGQMAKPEPAGQAVQLGDQMGFPPSIIGADLETYQQVDKGQKAAAAVRGNPFVANYIAKNEIAAQVSNDDYSNLDRLSTRLTQLDLPGAFQKGWKLFKEQHPILTETGRGFSQAFGDRPIGFTEQQKKDFPMMYETFGLELTLLDAGLRSMSGLFGAAGGLAGGTMRELGVNEAWANRFGRDIRMMTEMAAMSPLFPDIVRTPTIGTKAGVKDVSFEDFMATVRGMETRAQIDEFLARRDGGPADQHKPMLQIEFQKADAQALDNAVQTAAETNTKTRAPQLLQDFIQGHETGTIQLPARAVMDLYAAENKVPAKGDGLLGFVPGLFENLPASLASGVEIKIPVADYIAHVDPTVHERLKEDIRFSEDGVTGKEITEAKEVEAAQQEKVAIAAVEVNGKLYTGVTHPDALEVAAKDIGISFDELLSGKTGERVGTEKYGIKEGFVTTQGRFVGREEAAQIANKQDQVEPAMKPFAEERLSTDVLKADETIDYDKAFKAVDAINAGRPVPAPPKPIEVYHGSPYEFEAFDISKIGTGEGAQSYGHGIYVAEAKAVGEDYARNLGFSPEKTAFQFMQAVKGDRKAAVEAILDTPVTNGKSEWGEPIEVLNAAIKLIESGADVSKLPSSGGNLYRAVINAPREAFVDFDLPLSQQPQIVKDIVDRINPMAATASNPEFQFHQILRSKRAAELLAEAGIPGIRYLDQGSRFADKSSLQERLDAQQAELKRLEESAQTPHTKGIIEGVRETIKGLEEELAAKPTFNFVIFDPSIVTILERNGQLLRQETVKAELNLGLRPLFSTPLPTMDKPLFDRYNDLIKKQQEALIEKTREWALGKNRNKEWEAKEAEMEVIAKADVATMPDLVADRLIRNGVLPSGGKIPPEQRKLDTAIVEQILGKDHAIPDSMLNGSIHPDDMAQLAGYRSGTDMLNDLNILNEILKSTGETTSQYQKRLVEERTQELTSAAMGEDAKIVEAARALALSDIHLEILSAEMKALAAEAKIEPPMSRDQIKEIVQDHFEGLPVNQARNFKQFQAASMRAGRKTEMQLMAGKTAEAFQAKQQQVVSFMLSKESERFRQFLETTEGKFNDIMRKDSRGSTDQEYFDQTRSMLASVGYVPSKAIPASLSALADFLPTTQGTAAVANWLTDPRARTGDPGLLTVEQMRELRKSVDSMMKAGRDAKTLDSVYGKAQLDNVVKDIVEELQRFPFKDQPAHPSISQRTGSLARSVNAWLLLVERMLDYTDKFNPKGPLTVYMDRPLRDSNVKEIELTEKVTHELRQLRQYTDKSINDLIPNNVIPSSLSANGLYDMTRADLRQLMGYMGSKSGRQKVYEGFFGKPELEEIGRDVNGKPVRRMTQEAQAGQAKFVIDVLKLIEDNATLADHKWVAGMHKIYDHLWEESAAMQERYTGVVADKINPVKMTSQKHGEFEGGYWPIRYDPNRSNIKEHLFAKNDDLFHRTYVQAVTPQGYTIARTAFADPLDLTGVLTSSHIRGVIHDIAFREAVRNAQKLISHPEFMTAMRQYWGVEYANLLPGWLKDIANSSRVDDSYAIGAAFWMSTVRQNVTNAVIGLNPSTVVKHGMSAIGMSAVQVGAIPLAKSFYELGFREALKSGRDLMTSKNMTPITQDFKDALLQVMDPSEYGDGVRQFILDSSAVMRNRQRQASDNIRAQYEKNVKHGLTQSYVDLRNLSLDIGRVPVAVSDALSAMPTWLAAYRREVMKGETHADAVFVADKEVSRAHGSTFIGDKPMILRQPNTPAGEVMRAMTSLYNYWNHNFNSFLQWMWDAGAKFGGREEPGARMASLGNRMFWLAAWAIVAEELATPALDEHKRSLGQRLVMATIRHFGGYFPFLRDATNAAAHGTNPTMGLGGTFYNEMGKAAGDVNRMVQGKPINQNWFIHAMTALSMATGLGNVQLGKTGSYAKDLATGRERLPGLTLQGFNQFRQGVRTGHSKPRRLP